MLTNADCTLYRYNATSGGYDRFYFSECYWSENEGAAVRKLGMQHQTSVTVFLYDDTNPPQNPTKDMMVKGNCPFTFTNTTPATVSASLKAFIAAYKVRTVMAVDNRMFGGLPHIEVTLK